MLEKLELILKHILELKVAQKRKNPTKNVHIIRSANMYQSCNLWAFFCVFCARIFFVRQTKF